MKISWRRCAEPESIVLALAAANWARIAYLIQRDSGIACIVCPWYQSWGYVYEPLRLLAAGVFIRLGRPWNQALAAFLAGQVFVERLYMGFSPNDLLAVRAGVDEWPFATQGLVGAAVLGVSWFRLARRTRLRAWLRWPTRIAVALMVLVAAGIASNLASYWGCENRVAAWVARDVLGGQPFTAWGGVRGWGDSAAVFRRAGIDIREDRPEGDDAIPRVTVGATHVTLPFVVRVHYSAGGQRSGEKAFLCLFGLTKPFESARRFVRVDRAVAFGTTVPWAWIFRRP